ncbi:MAG: hypothetical protein M0Z55_05510 [Peptococcaceae bacterium]|nr:hypothetical protein [Peptococcaceae bacterium]
MEVTAVDFNSVLLAAQDQADFLRASSYKGKKSFVKQLSGNTYFVSLQAKHHPVKLLLDNANLRVDRDEKVIAKIAEWQNRGLVSSPHDILALLGFEVLERDETQLETIEVAMAGLEEKIMAKPQKTQQTQILYLHRQAIYLKKQLNEYLAVFVRCRQNNALWEELILRTQSSLDNARQMVELMENLRDAYQASVDNKLNDVMKLLTVLATILLPINLLTSFFGMNFQNMPLIHTNVGIYLLYLVSVIFIGGSIIYFKRRDWL